MTSVLRFDDVAKTYDVGSVLTGSRSHLRALDGVSFTVEPGETLGLVGESGSGKSTIARIAAGLLQPTSGRATFLGQAIDHGSHRQRLALRVQLGFVFQNPYESLNPRQRIAELLELPFRIHLRLSGAERRRHVHDLLDRVGLSPAGISGASCRTSFPAVSGSGSRLHGQSRCGRGC